MFDAGAVVEPLKYTFKPFVDLEGVIKEPSDTQIAAYQAAMRKEMLTAAKEMGAGPKDLMTLSQDEFLAVLEKTDPAESEATLRRQAEMTSVLCSGKPTTAQLLKLPLRARIRFIRWLQTEVLNPEVEAGGGTPALNGQRSKVAG